MMFKILFGTGVSLAIFLAACLVTWVGTLIADRMYRWARPWRDWSRK